jgi:hypothetical protein
VKPPNAVAGEDRVPVDVAGLHRTGRGVAAVRATERAAHAEASLDEVEAVANAPPDAVVGTPRDVRLVDTSLQNQILEQAADRVVRERGHDRSS